MTRSPNPSAPLKLNVIGNWPADFPTDFARNYLGREHASEVIFTTSEEADCIAVFNSLGRPRAPTDKHVVGFVFEPSWTSNCDPRLSERCDVLFCHNPARFSNAACVRYLGGVCWPWVPLEEPGGLVFRHSSLG